MVSPTSPPRCSAPYLLGRSVAEIQVPGEAHQRIGSSPEPPTAELSLQTPAGKALQDSIVKEVNEGKRPTRIGMSAMTLGFFLIQTLLLYLLIVFIPYLIGIEIFWLCNNEGNMVVLSWIGVTVVSAGIIRTYTESSQFSEVQILHLRPLSPLIVLEPCPNCVSYSIPLPQLTTPTVIRNRNGNGRWVPGCLSSLPSVPRFLWAAQKLNHGMIVVLRPAERVDADRPDMQRLLCGVARGLFQALLLIFLTVLFGSTYQSSILESVIFISSFMGVVVISRTYSVYFCAWMEHATETIQLQYGTPAELTAIHSILVALPSVLIHNTTSGRRYAAGNCLDPNPDCTNHTSSIAKPLPLSLRLTTAVFCGTLVFGIAVAINYVLVGLHVNLLHTGFPGLSYLWIGVCVFVGLVGKKVFTDFECVDTLVDYVGTVSPGGAVPV